MILPINQVPKLCISKSWLPWASPIDPDSFAIKPLSNFVEYLAYEADATCRQFGCDRHEEFWYWSSQLQSPVLVAMLHAWWLVRWHFEIFSNWLAWFTPDSPHKYKSAIHSPRLTEGGRRPFWLTPWSARGLIWQLDWLKVYFNRHSIIHATSSSWLPMSICPWMNVAVMS